jgi:hypothetical protein
MKETLIMKHAVGGRIFIDTNKHPLNYTLDKVDEGWIFNVETPKNIEIDELLKVKNELNVFIFQEFEEQPVIKTWYYVKDGQVEYDAGQQRLTVQAQSRIVYEPDKFLS